MLQPQLPTNSQPTEETAAPMAGGVMGDDGEDDAEDIIAGLEEHLAQLQPQYKEYLVQTLADPAMAEPALNVLGIVAGKEVYDYFSEVVAMLQQQNSAPSGANTQAPSQEAQPIFNPQTKDTSTPAPQSGAVFQPGM